MHLQRTLLNKKSKLQRTQIFCCHFDKVQKEAKFSKLDSLKIILHIIVKEYRTVSDKVNFHRAVHCGGGKGTKIVKLRVHGALCGWWQCSMWRNQTARLWYLLNCYISYHKCTSKVKIFSKFITSNPNIFLRVCILYLRSNTHFSQIKNSVSISDTDLISFMTVDMGLNQSRDLLFPTWKCRS